MGLDKPEHGLTSAYADFMPVVPSVLGTSGGGSRSGSAPAELSRQSRLPV